MGLSIEQRIYSRNETLHVPHLLDLEVAQVLRRVALQGVVWVYRAEQAVRDLLDLRITQYAHSMLLPRIWQLRHNFSAYDAACIVVAEKLGVANSNFWLIETDMGRQSDDSRSSSLLSRRGANCSRAPLVWAVDHSPPKIAFTIADGSDRSRG